MVYIERGRLYIQYIEEKLMKAVFNIVSKVKTTVFSSFVYLFVCVSNLRRSLNRFAYCFLF